MAKNRKSGPVTAAEIEYIRLNMKSSSIQDIAEELGRNPDTISKVVSQIGSFGAKSEILDLKKRTDWNQIQEQFTEDEVELFKSHWNGIVNQFSSEIYYTESLQIIAAIKHDILSNRVLNDQMKIKKEIARLEKDLDDERHLPNPDRDRILSIENQISAYCMAEQVNGKEFREGSTRLMAVLKDLKALRADRISKVDDMKKSFSSLMKNIIEDPTLSKELGAELEKSRMAMEMVEKEFGLRRKFANGEFDRPLLNSDTVDMDDYQEEEPLEKETENNEDAN